MQLLTRCDDGERSQQHTEGRSARDVPDVDGVGLLVAWRRARGGSRNRAASASRTRSASKPRAGPVEGVVFSERQQNKYRRAGGHFPDCSQTQHQGTHVPRSLGRQSREDVARPDIVEKIFADLCRVRRGHLNAVLIIQFVYDKHNHYECTVRYPCIGASRGTTQLRCRGLAW